MRVFAFLFFAFIQANVIAQLDYSDRNGTLTVERFGTIHRDRNLVGYVSSINLEHKKSNVKSIAVLNLNADKLFSFDIENKSNYYLVESAFNGHSYAFLFLDVNSKSLIFQQFNIKGGFKKEYSRKLNNADLDYLLSHVTHNNNYTGFNQFLHEIGHDGFVLMLNTIEENLNTCQIIKLSEDSSEEKNYAFITESPIYEANFLGQSKNQIYFSFEINGKAKGQYFTETIALNKETLASIYEIQQLKDQDYFFFPKIALTSDTSDNIKLVGYYFNAEKNMDKDFYDGFAYWSLESKGDFNSERYISFQKDIYDLKFKNDNRGKDEGFLFLQNVFMDKGQNIYLISEGYQKVASGSTIGVGVVGMGVYNDYTRVKTYNIALSRFDENFNYKGTQIIEKQTNTIQLAYLYNQPIFEVGKLYNRYGMFDYLATEVSISSFQIFFKNFRLESLSGGNYKVGRYTKHITGAVEYENIEKLPNTNETYILPNDDGRVLFVERIKKKLYFDFKK